MKKCLLLLSFYFLVFNLRADVNVFVESSNGKAVIKYEVTDGEVVRAFALDVQVDAGQIVGISDFFVGESTENAQGYGIFLAAVRDHSTVVSGSEIIWGEPDYTPIAVPADNPGGTLPGLNSSGVTLEIGGLWDPNVSAAVPPSSGLLCALELSEAATVSISGNAARGAVVSASPGQSFSPNYSGGYVDPAGPTPTILGLTLIDGMLTIEFAGGELESAPAVDGTWEGTGNSSGSYVEEVSDGTKFFRVRGQ